jgi:hypothetical protein
VRMCESVLVCFVHVGVCGEDIVIFTHLVFICIFFLINWLLIITETYLALAQGLSLVFKL